VTTIASPATAPALALKWIQKLRSGPGGCDGAAAALRPGGNAAVALVSVIAQRRAMRGLMTP
jgi:hypothetical protein